MGIVSDAWSGRPLFDSVLIPTGLPASHTSGIAEVIAVSVYNDDGTTTTTYTSYTAADTATVELYTVRPSSESSTQHSANDEYHVYTGEALRWVVNRFTSNYLGSVYLENNINLNGQNFDWSLNDTGNPVKSRACQGQDFYGQGKKSTICVPPMNLIIPVSDLSQQRI